MACPYRTTACWCYSFFLPHTTVDSHLCLFLMFPVCCTLPYPLFPPSTSSLQGTANLPGGVFLRDITMAQAALWIDDPLRFGMNIGAGSFAMWHVQV